MKTPLDLNFDKVLTDSFHSVLKPLGYKEKGSNFYLSGKVGKLVHVQKSTSSTKDTIRFTTSIAFFSAKYWSTVHNVFSSSVPTYPTEADCILSKRIGHLVSNADIWYTLSSTTVLEELVIQVLVDLEKHILPFLEEISSLDDLLKYIAPKAYLERIILLLEAGRQLQAIEVLNEGLKEIKLGDSRSLLELRAQQLGLTNESTLSN